MKARVKLFQISLIAVMITGIVAGVSIALTLVILAGGWMVNWIIPGIPYEFASIIAGQGLLIAGLLLALAANLVAKEMARQEFLDQNTNDADEDDEDDDSAEAAEWLAERIADITHAKLTQTTPKSRRYTARPRGK